MEQTFSLARTSSHTSFAPFYLCLVALRAARYAHARCSARLYAHTLTTLHLNVLPSRARRAAHAFGRQRATF